MSNNDRSNCVTTLGVESYAGDKRRVAQVSLGVAASMLMASAASAQTNLPPLAVETKKAPAKAKAKAAPRAKQAPPPVAEAPPAGPIDPSLIPGSYVATTASSSKQTAPLLDTPQTVSVIPGTIIQERQATNLTEVLRNTPGISFEAGENGFGTSALNFQIRGFNASGNIYIDGSRSSGIYPRDAFNVDRVEVFKGAAADNGRGGGGGYVNIVSKLPVAENFARAEVGIGFDEYDSEMRRRATFDINQRIGTTGVRLNGMIEDGGVAGREIAETKGWGFAPSITFGMGTDKRLTIAYEHIDRDDLPDWGIPGAFVKGTFRYRSANPTGSRDTFYGLRSDTDRIKADSVLARMEWDLSDDTTLSNQTRFARVDRFSAYTIMGNPALNAGDPTIFNSSRNYYDRVGSSLTNDTNLTTRQVLGGMRHTISAGIELSREDADALRRPGTNYTGSLPGYSIFDPDPDRVNPVVPDPTQRSRVDIRTAAAYLYDTIDLTRQLQLTGGVRVEHYKVEIDSKTVPGGAPAGIFDGFNQSETTWSGKIGLVYKPVEQGSLYASYGTSTLPPGSFLSNPDISRTGSGTGDNSFPGLVPGADPVRFHNYEVGVKWNFFGGRLTTAAALFRTEKHNAAYNGTGSDPDIVYGKQIVQGLEITAAGNLTERWKVFGGLALIDSERKHGGAVDRAQTDYDGTTMTTSGDELAFTPKFTASLWSTYKVTDLFTLGAGVQYVSESWVGRPDDALRIIPNGTYGKLPDYFVFNAMASYELTDNIMLQLNIDNLFDEKYARSLNWNAQRADLGAPRTYWLSAKFKY
jgi:catecholate siderophore receptor